MRTLKPAMLASALVLAATGIAVPAAAAPAERTYTYVDLGLLPGIPLPAGQSGARGVNTSGQVVGTTDDNNGGGATAFVWRDGRMTALGSLDPGFFSGSGGFAINDAGVVVGQTSVKRTEPPHAMLWRDGVMTDLGTGFGPGSFSRAEDINNSGLVVGVRAATQLGRQRATMWRDGRIIALPGLSARNAEAMAVNDTGEVVGTAQLGTGAWRAVRWVNRRIQDLGTLGSGPGSGWAADISNTGVVVGAAPVPGPGVHAFAWRDGVMRDLGTLPTARSSEAYGVNDRDQAVGLSVLPGGQHDNVNRAVLYENGQVIDLNTRVSNLPGDVSLFSARAINNAGYIVGDSCFLPCDPFGELRHGFLLVPNP
jgi:probable HAF family extracellular repeat protein